MVAGRSTAAISLQFQVPSSTEVEAPPLEQTLTEDFHRIEKLETCPGNKTFIYLFYISGLLFEVLPTKCRKVHKVFLLQFNIIAPTPYNACYLFMVKLSVPTILSSSVSFLFGFQLKLWCLSGISYHFSHRRSGTAEDRPDHDLS